MKLTREKHEPSYTDLDENAIKNKNTVQSLTVVVPDKMNKNCRIQLKPITRI